MSILRTLTNVLIVVGYVAAGLFAGAIAGAFVHLGGTGGVAVAQIAIGGGGLAGLLFGLRRAKGRGAQQH
jgi:hypothetical protein